MLCSSNGSSAKETTLSRMISATSKKPSILCEEVPSHPANELYTCKALQIARIYLVCDGFFRMADFAHWRLHKAL